MKRKKEITATQIARLAKVSPATVSRALNPSQCWRISREKRDEIRNLSRQYGFKSRSARKAGAFAKTFRIAFLLGTMERDLTGGGNLRIRLMCDILQRSGYILELIRVDFSPDKLVASVRDILKSEEADVYVIGGAMLNGQSLELLHRLSSRIILILNMEMMVYPEFHWLSYFICDFRSALREALQNIPDRLLPQMIFFGHNSFASLTRLETVRQLGTEIGRDFSRLETYLFGNKEYIPPDQAYRIARREIAGDYPYLSRFKVFICSGNSADVLYDELVLHGKVPGRDFHMIAFCRKSSLTSMPAETINYICRDMDAEAGLLCEQILELTDDPTPRKVISESVFVPVEADNGIDGSDRTI